MTLRVHERTLLLAVGLFVGLALSVAEAQAPASRPASPRRPVESPKPAEPRQVEPPTTQPAPDPELQREIEKLLELRDKLEREAREKGQLPPEKEGQPDISTQPGGQVRPPATPEGVRPKPTKSPAGMNEVRPAQPGAGMRERPSVAELRKRAVASTQQVEAEPAADGGEPPAAAPGQAEDEVPDDYVGPPTRLKDYTGSGSRRAEPAVAPPGDAEAEAQPLERRPRDEDEEWFNFDGVPWEDVVMYFVERVGKPLMSEDLIIGGTLTYRSDGILTKDEAIDELNLIMQEKGYRFVETERHIRVIPLAEMPQWVPLTRTFPTLAAFEEANLRDMDYVAVYYQVQDLPAQTYVDMFGDALPDYSRIVALQDSNQIKIIALARDVRKFMALKDMIDISPSDPRELEFFEIQTNAREIERMVREFLNIGGGAGVRVQMERDPRTGRMVPRQVPATTGGDQDVQIVADDRTNSIIVKATKDRMAEIERLIKEFDKKPEIGKFDTVAVKVKHWDATEMANLLNQIFQQEQGSGQSPAWQIQQRLIQQQQAQAAAAAAAQGRRGQPRRPVPTATPPGGAVSPEDIFVEGAFERAKKTIRITPEPRQNLLYVYANEEGHARVANMVQELDQPQPDNFKLVTLEHAKVEDISALVSELARGVAETGASAPRGGVTILPDEARNGFYVMAPPEAMERIESLIMRLDVPAAEQTRHIVKLENLKPSDVATFIQSLLGSDSTGPTPPRYMGRRGVPQRPAPAAAATKSYQLIPLDEAQLLIVICADDDWEKIDETVQLWDTHAISSTPKMQRFELEHGNAATVAQTLGEFYRSYQHPILGRSGVAIKAEGNGIWVYGVQPVLDEIAGLIAQLDVESSAEKLEILQLVNADASVVAQQVQGLFGGRGGPRGAGSVFIQAEPITNSLIVQADAADLAKVKEFALQMDERIAAQATEQRFFELRYARASEVAAAVQNVFGSGGGVVGRGMPARAQVRAMAAGAQVIVEAPKDKFTAIETFIRQLDDPKGRVMTVKNYKLPGVDVNQVAQTLMQTMRNQPRADGLQATFIPDVSAEQIIVSAPEDMLPKIDELVKQFSVGAEELTLERQLYAIQFADAAYIADILQRQLVAQVGPKRGQIVASRISIAVDDRQNQIIVNAPKFVHPLAAELIGDLDKEGPGLTPVTVTLKYADPNQIAQMIQAMYRPTGQRSQHQDVQVTVTNGQLVIRAPQKKLEEIQELVATVDAKDESGIQMRTYDLKVLNAIQVQSQVQMFLAQLKKNVKAGQLPPGAFAEPTTNTLVVLAPPDIMPMIDQLITELEGKSPPSGQVQAYPLKFVRAEQFAPTVDAMLKAKVAEREGVKQGTLRTAVFADSAGNRLLVYAPPEYQSLAAGVLQTLDVEAESTDIVHIITLENGDATQIAQTLNVIIAADVRGGGMPGGRGGAAAVRVTADAGSNSLVLAGMPKDLAEVEKWVEQLETESTRIPELQIFKLRYAGTEEVQTTLEGLFGRARNPQDAVTITADEYAGKLIIAANRRKMRLVEAYIQQLDHEPESSEVGLLPCGQQLYFVDINRGDASDIAWDVRDMLPDSQGRCAPDVEADWFGEYIRVTCRPSEFPQIESLIREFERRVKPERVFKVVDTKGRDTKALVEYIRQREGREVVYEEAPASTERESFVETLWGDDEQPPSLKDKKPGRENVRPTGGGAVRPVEQTRHVEASGPFRLAAYTEPPPAGPTTRAVPAAKPAVSKPPSATPPSGASASSASDGGVARSVESPLEKDQVHIVGRPDGTILVTGPKDAVEDVTGALDTIMEDLAVGEVVRIFRFKYGDVSAAAEILTMMFDVRQQQRIIMPQMPQRGQQGRPGEDERGRQQDPMEQFRQMVGAQQQQQKGESGQLRIATDPGHNYLIVKCQEVMLPEIRRLLRELDIPPGEVQVKVFQLKNLLAEETAENIKDVLGISKVQQRRGGTRQQMPGGRGGAQQQLMEMLQQQLVSVPGVEGGAKVERVEIVPNATTNSLLVSSPPEVMELIERVIGELEELEGRGVVGIYYYPLRNARADDVLPLLREIFEGATGSGGGGPRSGRGSGGGGSPAALGPVTISADPRVNTIIYACEGKDRETVERQIKTLDIEGNVSDVEMYICQYGNAETIATAVEAIFAAVGGGGRGPRGGAAATGAVSEVRIVPEPGTNAILVWGPPDKRGLILQRIGELDELANKFEIAAIPVKNVPPSQIVGFIFQFLDVSPTAASGTGGGRQRGGQTEEGGPQIVPNDNDQTLIVRGTQRQIDQVRELVERFDDADVIAQQVKIIEIPRGQDLAQLANEIERVVNESEASFAEKTGRPARRLTVGTDEYTHVLILGGDPTLFGMAVAMVDQLGTIRAPNVQTIVIDLEKLAAEDVVDIINDLQSQGGGGGSRRSGGSVRPTSGSRRSTPAPAPSSPPSAPRRGSTPRRRGAVSPDPLQGWNPNLPADVRVTPWAQPCIGASVLSPVVALFVAQTAPAAERTAAPAAVRGAQRRAALREAQDEFAAGGPRLQPTMRLVASQPPPRKPPAKVEPPEPVVEPEEEPEAMTPAEEAAADEAAADEAGASPAGPASTIETMTGVAGSLRGPVTAQAIDSKRVMITGDEDDLGFIAQVLAMMEQSTSPAGIRVFTLRKAKAAALAPIIEKAIEAKTAVLTARPGPQDKFSINAEARSNSLIVSASERIMEEIEQLIEQLDVDTEETDVRSVPLVHVRAVEAVAQLKPIIERLNTIRQVPKESQVSISAIDRNNSVMVVGTPKDLEEIERLVRELDVELTEEQQARGFVMADVILVQLRNGQAEDVAKVLTDMIKEQQENARKADPEKPGEPFVKVLRTTLPDGTVLPELNLDRPIKIIAEKGTNSLIIFSTKDNNEALHALVAYFDTLPIGADTDVKVFALKHATAEQVAQLMEDIFKDKDYLSRPSDGDSKGVSKGILPPVPPGVAAKGLPYPLVVQHDARSNTVIVIGRSDAVLLAGGLIKELDRPTTELGLKAYVLELKDMQATQVADKLDKLLDERAKSLGGDKGAARDSAVIQPEERSNALIVLATEEVYGMIEDLVLQLDAAKKYSVVDLRYRALKYADAVKLQAMLETMFQEKEKAESALNKEAKDTLKLLADVRSNSLLMTGTRDYLAEAEALLAELDQPYDGTVVFKGIKVRLNSAANVASLLEDMIDKALKQQDSKLKGTPIHVTADPVTDTLLLAAAREDMAVIERWIEILDRPSEIGRMTLIVPLRRASAEDASKAVENVFKKQGGSQTGGEIDVTVAADTATNAVVAFGPPAILNDIEDFVRKLDGTEAASGVIVRMFKLDQADAEDAGELLTRILELEGGTVGGRGGAGGGGSAKETDRQVLVIWQRQHPELGMETLKAFRKDIRVLADIRTNSLIVSAPPESMPLMESLVEAVDLPPDAAKIRVFRLRNADAEQMVKMLQELFERKTSASTSGRTTGDEAERVLTLEGMGAEGGRQEIAFTTDLRTNSVIAAGTPGYLDLVEEVILELDTIPIKDRETFVYAPRNITAEALQASIREFSEAEQQRLQDIGEEVSQQVRQEREVVAISNEDANRLLLDVDPRFKDTVMRVINELDQPPPQVIIQVLIVEVTMDNELDLGVEFAFQDLQYAKAGPTDTTTFDYVGGTDIGAAGSGLGGFSFTITGADFNFLFRTLQNEGNLRVLSRPQIVAMDNKEAKIDISDDVPYVSGTQTSTTGQISTAVSRTKVGITLEVTPQINPDGFVRMEISQKVSDQTGSTVDVGQGVTSPIFFTREANTTITVKDHETVVLGGLITSRVENREQKVPLIGDIPGLGLLFRNQTDSTRRTELLLVLTPHVIRTVDEYRLVSRTERNRLGLVAPETLADPLMQGLRAEPGELEGQQPLQPVTPPDEEAPPLDGALEPKEEEYGPIRPALREAPVVDPNSYDVPLASAGARP